MTRVDDFNVLQQTDADEYTITLVPANGDPDLEISMTSQDAMHLAANLLIGAVYDTSDREWREWAWREFLVKRLQQHSEWKDKYA